ncbi:arabinogalactan endo-beta-1,4-galactanase [Treponema sp.]|uniref:glycoside hydrolase family 53 protein n=1 Tax=Treponema sp. TaxID=166 RepID=UPI002A801CD6|nr:glycosyl hydrolase 53 family protein [Treponema sp.]MCI6442915.1 glycosyl hydrolase 53 family protein [Spirochaetia bacterium]MDY4133545.1 glycosyl hydrolase 53 family protein [Treponema sp.]
MKKITAMFSLCVWTLVISVLSGCTKKQTVSTINPSWEKISVLPVMDISDDFMMGVDVSSLLSVEASGAKFYGADGKPADPIALLKAGGANAVRIRVWNDPKTEDGRTYGGGGNDINVACKLGKRAMDLGMKVLIDFHYSDFWADSKRQKAPKAWKNFKFDEKQAAIREFTINSLTKLKKAGVRVSMVQMGNEIDNGLCGEIYDAEVCYLLKTASRAVRDFDRNIKIAVHYTDPLAENYLEGKATMLEKNKVDYDIFGISYYPYLHGDVKQLYIVLRKIANFYNKKVMVMEVAYPFTDSDGDGYKNAATTSDPGLKFNYPITVEGQAIAVRDVIEAVAKVRGAGIGVFYWEPAWIPPQHYDITKIASDLVFAYNSNCWLKNGSGWATFSAHGYDKDVKSKVNGGKWDNQAFFDFDGNVLDSINVWNYAKYGSVGKRKVVRVNEPTVKFERNGKNKLPEKVKVIYNDGSKVYETVEWDRAGLDEVRNKTSLGQCKVRGKTINGDDVTCIVNFVGSNLLVNGNFESGKIKPWNISNDLGRGKPEVVRNYENAKQGLFYATGWDPDNFDFTLWQEIKVVEKGTYNCFAFFEGTGVRNPSGTCLMVEIKKKNGTSVTFMANADIPNQWKKFDRVEIPSIEIDDSVESVIVKIRMKAEYAKFGKGAWLVCDDVNFLLVK